MYQEHEAGLVEQGRRCARQPHLVILLDVLVVNVEALELPLLHRGQLGHIEALWLAGAACSPQQRI